MSHDDVVDILLKCLLSSTELLTDFIAPTACLFHALCDRQPRHRTERACRSMQRPHAAFRGELWETWSRDFCFCSSWHLTRWERSVRLFRGCTCVTPATLIIIIIIIIIYLFLLCSEYWAQLAIKKNKKKNKQKSKSVRGNTMNGKKKLLLCVLALMCEVCN